MNVKELIIELLSYDMDDEVVIETIGSIVKIAYLSEKIERRKYYAVIQPINNLSKIVK